MRPGSFLPRGTHVGVYVHKPIPEPNHPARNNAIALVMYVRDIDVDEEARHCTCSESWLIQFLISFFCAAPLMHRVIRLGYCTAGCG
jgi:hypothetical protein